MKTFEITLPGFDGATDETDHLVKWITSDQNEENTLKKIKSIHPNVMSIVEIPVDIKDGGIDYVLKNGVLITIECGVINEPSK